MNFIEILNIKKMKTLILKTIVLFGGFTALVLAVQSCKKTTDPPKPTNEEELITTLKVELKDTASGQLLIYYFRDLDGEGGKPPSQLDTIKLSPNRTYATAIKFLNESDTSNVEDITNEINNESKDHFICFSAAGANLVVTRTDSDGTFEVGLTSRWKTGNVSKGHITITLKHQPGVKNGQCDPGATDAEVIFPLDLK